jgi:chemotaxis response regulator CheB
MPVRDMTVIGDSAEAFKATEVLASALPAILPAAILVTPHQARRVKGLLPDILNRVGPLRTGQLRAGRSRPGAPGRALRAVHGEDGMQVG